MRTLQIKAVAFEVAKEFFGPHAADVVLQGRCQGQMIGGQQPGSRFTLCPMGRNVGRMLVLSSEQDVGEPATLAGLDHQLGIMLPVSIWMGLDTMVGFLTQDISSAPGFELGHDFLSTHW